MSKRPLRALSSALAAAIILSSFGPAATQALAQTVVGAAPIGASVPGAAAAAAAGVRAVQLQFGAPSLGTQAPSLTDLPPLTAASPSLSPLRGRTQAPLALPAASPSAAPSSLPSSRPAAEAASPAKLEQAPLSPAPGSAPRAAPAPRSAVLAAASFRGAIKASPAGATASTEKAPTAARAESASASLERLGSQLSAPSAPSLDELRKALDEAFSGGRAAASATDDVEAARAALLLGDEGVGSNRLLAPSDRVSAKARTAAVPAPVEGAAAEQGLRELAQVLTEMFRGEPWMQPLLRPYQGRIHLSQAILVFQAMLNAAAGYSTGALVDSALAAAGSAAAAWFAGLAALTAGKVLITKFNWVLTERIKVGLRHEFRMALFARLQRLPASFAGRGDAAELSMRLLNDASKVPVKNVDIPIQTPQLAIQLLLSAGLALGASWKLALAGFASLPALAELSKRFGRKAEEQQKSVSAMQAELMRMGQDLVAGDRDARVAGAEGKASEIYAGSSRRYEEIWLDVAKLVSNYNALRDLLQAVSSDLLILGAGLLGYVLTGSPTVGQVTSLRSYASDLRGAFTGLLDRYNDGRAMDGGLSRVRELWQAVAASADKPETKPWSGSALSLRGLEYALPGRGKVLRGVDLEVRPGERALVVAPDEPSRRALVDLLLRLDSPAGGAVLAGGTDVADLRREDLVSKVAVVSRDAAVLDGSLRENLLFGLPGPVPDERLLAALRSAGASSLLSLGLDARVAEGTKALLDAEQRQRLSLVRAVLRDPEILVGEDLGDGLEAEQALALWRDFQRLSRGRTTVAVTARPSHGETYGKIVVLDEGAVVERGTHEELQGRGGRYARLADLAAAAK